MQTKKEERKKKYLVTPISNFVVETNKKKNQNSSNSWNNWNFIYSFYQNKTFDSLQSNLSSFLKLPTN